MKVIIAGGRKYQFSKADFHRLASFALQHNIKEVVSGGATGADTCGHSWANGRNIDVKQFPAKWEEYGKQAGFLRNIEMADYADALIAFKGGVGTAHMIRIATERKLLIFDWRRL